ncbi:Nbp2p [Sugiyamaella lignohabitans]|uniref:Nbp2p n=1 Tax=Sugiyamaella lignohabitans TaxID=796027 RepID=A0A167E9Q2_9ASCO|nr:Nbp2p [Sugiyamaella lignohabitans]ANB13813.1 Nbp2p [Sugiyamaella lignohabitans]
MAAKPPSPIASSAFQSGASHDISVLQDVLSGVSQPHDSKTDVVSENLDSKHQQLEHTDNDSPENNSDVAHQNVDAKGSVVYQDLEEIPNFHSALSYATVRDFAYPEFHPLHYGVPEFEQASGETDDDEDYEPTYEYNDTYDANDPHSHYYNDKSAGFEDGPPWQQDSDLNSPVIKSHEVGDRISKEYQFSVASADEIHGRAVALFDFTPENDNEAPLQEGQIVWISYRHGQGWLVAEDPETGETGLVPEEYVQLLNSISYEEDILQDSSEPAIYQSPESDSEGWVDEAEPEGDAAEPATEPVVKSASDTDYTDLKKGIKDLSLRESEEHEHNQTEPETAEVYSQVPSE